MEESKKWIIVLLNAIIFVLCMGFVIVGQRKIEAAGLALQIVGLAGILLLIYLYNRKYQ